MLSKLAGEGRVQVTFTIPAMEGCECLYLVGDFNVWNAAAHPMQRNEEGNWELTLELEPGREYQYRYRTDVGQWHNDPAADDYVPNPHGSENSVVRT
jgi:1,4-alpha-glucan branching enzyme